MKTAYIVKAYRTAVGKAPKGLFRFKRPDELAADTIKYLINSIPNLDKRLIDDIFFPCCNMNKGEACFFLVVSRYLVYVL